MFEITITMKMHTFCVCLPLISLRIELLTKSVTSSSFEWTETEHTTSSNSANDFPLPVFKFGPEAAI